MKLDETFACTSCSSWMSLSAWMSDLTELCERIIFFFLILPKNKHSMDATYGQQSGQQKSSHDPPHFLSLFFPNVSRTTLHSRNDCYFEVSAYKLRLDHIVTVTMLFFFCSFLSLFVLTKSNCDMNNWAYLQLKFHTDKYIYFLQPFVFCSARNQIVIMRRENIVS